MPEVYSNRNNQKCNTYRLFRVYILLFNSLGPEGTYHKSRDNRFLQQRPLYTLLPKTPISRIMTRTTETPHSIRAPGQLGSRPKNAALEETMLCEILERRMLSMPSFSLLGSIEILHRLLVLFSIVCFQD